MPHLLVDQLRFTRAELLRALDGVPEADAQRRLEPMNSISWMVGHLAWHEQSYWLTRAQGIEVRPELAGIAGKGSPASTPPLAEMLDAWHAVTAAADPWLDALTPERLAEHLMGKAKPLPVNVGSMLLRVTYHYWFHIGEITAVRQLLRHVEVPEFVGDPVAYRQEAAPDVFAGD